MFRLSDFYRRGCDSQGFSGSKGSGKQHVRKSRPRSAKSTLQFEQLEVRLLLTGDFDSAVRFGSVNEDVGTAITTDASGNVYTTGYFSGTVDFDPGSGTADLTSAGSEDIFVSKLDSAGNFVWAKRMGGASSDKANGIAVDGSGNVYTTGVFQGTADFDPGVGTGSLTSVGSTDVFVSKLDSSGNFVWAKAFGGSSVDVGNGISVDAGGNVYTTGSFLGTSDFDPGNDTTFLTSAGSGDVFVTKLDSLGNFVWAKRLGGTSDDIVEGMSVDAAGNVYTTGHFMGTADYDPGSGTFNLASAGFRDVFVSKLDSAGNFIWAKRLGGGSSDEVEAIAVDGLGNVYTTGYFTGTADFNPGDGTANLIAVFSSDVFVSKLDGDGNYVWAKRLSGSGNEKGKAIAVDSSGNVYTTGTFTGISDFDPGAGTASLTTAGLSDVFVSRLDSAGDFIWAKRLGGTNDDFVASIAVDGSGNVYTTGSFYGTADFDPGIGTANLTSAGGGDIFVSKLSPDMLYTLGDFVTGDLRLRRNGAMLELWFNGSFTFGQYILLEAYSIDAIRSVRIKGGSFANNSFTLDFAAGGSYQIDQGIHYAAGTSTSDLVQLVGVGNEGFTYQPSSAVAGSGKFLTYGKTLSFTGVEFAAVTRTQALAIEPQGSADVLTVAAATGFGGAIGSRITGTSGGTAIVPLTFDNVRDVTIDTGAKDGLLAQSNDSITFTTGSLEAAGMKNLIVIGGKGADNMVVNSVDLGLPISGGAFRFDGGAGSDRLAVTGDADYRINDARIASSNGGMIIHDEVERATLNGGAANNILIGVGYSGALTLNGLGGNDLLRGGTGTNTILGGIGDDRLFGNHGNDSLDGGSGNDQLFGGLGDDTLNGGAGVDLVWFDGTNNSDSLRLQFLTATTANFVRKPRGLVSVLEQDSFVYDASDEVVINALDGDDLITIDAAFTILGLVDGGNGADTCTAPATWTKVSC
jgi:RTX calcium-binding nonapeptide repeat (4 copies)/Beta-propeller repeat